MRELKTFEHIVTKAKGDAIQGLATVFGVVDSYGDRSHPGLFSKAEPGRVRFLFNNQFDSVPVAKVTGLWEVTRADLPAKVRSTYPEASGGVLVEREYLDTPRGQEVKAAVLAGAIAEMSYGYEPVRTEQGYGPSGEPVRELYQVDVYEVSDVAILGAVPGTMANLAAKAGYKYAGRLGPDPRLAQLGARLDRLGQDMAWLDLRAAVRRKHT